MLHATNLPQAREVVEARLDITRIAASIVSGAIASRVVETAGDIDALTKTVLGTLTAYVEGTEKKPDEVLEPAVPIKRSVDPDRIWCLEDGRAFKSLRRHLMSRYNLTPDEYRKKWGLPSDYPMVAPNYAKARSALAKKMGLGRKGSH